MGILLYDVIFETYPLCKTIQRDLPIGKILEPFLSLPGDLLLRTPNASMEQRCGSELLGGRIQVLEIGLDIFSSFFFFFKY